MKSNLKKTLAIVLSLILTLSFVAVNNVNVYAASGKVTNVKVTNLKNNELKLNKGSKKSLNIKVSVEGKKISQDFTVKSSNKKVATVKKSGKKVIITAKKNGKANITISSKADKKKKTVIKVTVVTPVKKVTMSTSKATVKLGKTLQLKATVSSDASNKKLSWSSSNANVATVSSTGLVTAKKAGTTTITAKAQDGSGKKATCVIMVSDTNSITSIKVIDELSVEVELEYPQKLSKTNFEVHNKFMRDGNYVVSCEIEHIDTSDNKTYMIYVNDYIAYDSYVRVTVSGLKGVSAKTTKETIFSRKTKVLEREDIVKMSSGVESKSTISPARDDDRYYTFTNTALPSGLKAEPNARGSAVVSGTPSKAGIYNTKFTFTDELGNVEIRNVTFVIGDTDTIVAYAKPLYEVTSGNGEYTLDKSVSNIVYAQGGSGSYSYKIVGNAYGLMFTSSTYIGGTLYSAGTYKINIQVTDVNNENLTKTVVWTVNLKQGLTVSGLIKDATGQSMDNAYLEFYNIDENDKYFDYNGDDSDSTGSYSVTLPVGTYDVIAQHGNTRIYVGRKQITTSLAGFNIEMPLYKVIVYSDSAYITTFGKWYDKEENNMGSGNCLYLRAGTYSLKSESSCIEGKYIAELNITVDSNEVVTAKTKIYEKTSTITLNQAIETELTGTYTYFKFVPTQTGRYYFYSTSDNDTYGAICNENGTTLKSADSGGKGSNFEIAYEFTAGKTYYLAAKKYYSGTIAASVTVSTTSSN